MFFRRSRPKPKTAPNDPGLLKSVFLAHLILVLHVGMIGGLGCLALFFTGLVQFLPWIFFGGSALILYSGYRFYNKMKNEKKSLTEILSDPLLAGREVEISLLGGMVSLRMDGREPGLGIAAPIPVRQLEDPDSARVRELGELASLLEKNLITQEEYNKAKSGFFKS